MKEPEISNLEIDENRRKYGMILSLKQISDLLAKVKDGIGGNHPERANIGVAHAMLEYCMRALPDGAKPEIPDFKGEKIRLEDGGACSERTGPETHIGENHRGELP